VSGHIVDLRVRDIKRSAKATLLFVVDPRPYEIAVARAQAGLALTRKEVQGLRNGVVTADAGVSRRPRSSVPRLRTSRAARRIRSLRMLRSRGLEAQRVAQKRRWRVPGPNCERRKTTSPGSSRCCPRSS